jgi:hypothetical protein
MKHSILPEGEHVRRALRWYSDSRSDGSSALALINEASVRFDLSPLEEEWMLRNLLDRPAE